MAALWTTAFPGQVKGAKREAHRRINPMSVKRRDEAKIYASERVKFLSGRKCAVFPKLAATDVHHMRGRAGKLFLAQEFWLPVSRKGHRWIEDNMDEARAQGFLCQKGEWGKQPERK